MIIIEVNTPTFPFNRSKFILLIIYTIIYLRIWENQRSVTISRVYQGLENIIQERKFFIYIFKERSIFFFIINRLIFVLSFFPFSIFLYIEKEEIIEYI